MKLSDTSTLVTSAPEPEKAKHWVSTRSCACVGTACRFVARDVCPSLKLLDDTGVPRVPVRLWHQVHG